MLNKKCIILPVRGFLPNLAKLIVKSAEEQGKDLKDFIFILPNRRSGVYLRYFLSECLKSTTLAPEIYSMDDFIDYYYENYLSPDVKIPLWDACYLLFEIFSGLKHEGKQLFESFWNFVAYGIKIFQDFEELKIFQITSHELKQAIASLDIAEDSKISIILQNYPDAYESFYRILKEKGYSTRSLRYLRVSQEIGKDKFFEGKEIFLCPPYLLSKSEAFIIDSLQRRENFHILLQQIPYIHDKYLQICGEVGVESKSPCQDLETFIGTDVIELIPTDDDLSEILILRERLNELEDFELNSIRTGVILPDGGKLATVLELGIPEKVMEFNVSMGYSVGYSNAYIFLMDLIEFFKLLQSKNGDFVINLRKLKELISRNVVDREGRPIKSLYTFLDQLITRGYTLLNCEEIGSLIKKTENLGNGKVMTEWQCVYNGFIKRILQYKKFGEIVQTLINFYNGSGDLAVKYESKSDPEGVLYFVTEELLKLKNSEISKIAHEGDVPGAILDFLEFIRLILKSLSVPLKGTPLKGLQVIGFLETRLLNFDTLFVIDVQENILPRVEKEGDRILPLQIRTGLGLFDLRQREKLTEALFFSLIGAAKKCVLIYKDTRAEEPSHLLSILKECLGEKVKVQPHTTFYHSGTISFKKSLNFEQGVTKTEEMIEQLKKMTFSYTAIENYLVCPLKFLFSYVLDVKKEIEDEYDVRRMGSVIHKILERFFEKNEEQIKSEDLDKSGLLSDYFDRVAEEVLNEAFPVETPRIKLMKEGIKVRLKNSLRTLQKELEEILKEEDPGCFIRYEVEQEIRTKLNIGNNEVNFVGKIDRLDIYSGAYVVVDYKSSKSVDKYDRALDLAKLRNSVEKGRVAREILTPYIQLPIYYWLLSVRENLIPKSDELKIIVCVAPMKNKFPKIQTAKYKMDTADAQVVEDILKVIISEIIDLNIPFYPPEQEKRKDYCPKCNFRLVCKTL